MQPLFDLAHEPHGDDDRDDVALITHQRHRVQAAEHRLHHVDAVGNGPGVLQVGVDHDHADDCTQIGVAAEHLGGRVGDEDGQEGVGCIGEQLGKHIHRAGGIDVQKAVVHHEVQRFHDAHQEAGGHDGGDDGHKDVAQRLDSPLIPGCLGGGSLLHVLFAAALDAGQLDELVVDLVHRAGAEDDLQLTLCLKDALGALGVFQIFFADLAVVCNDQTQAGGAMRCRDDVLFAADAVQNLLCRVFVIHTASPFPECDRSDVSDLKSVSLTLLYDKQKNSSIRRGHKVRDGSVIDFTWFHILSRSERRNRYEPLDMDSLQNSRTAKLPVYHSAAGR